jgi:hypothetical protein
MFKDSASLLFWFVAFFMWSHSACFPFVFCSCAVFLRVFFVCVLLLIRRPKHVVKDSGNQHTIKLHVDGEITYNTCGGLSPQLILVLQLLCTFNDSHSKYTT